MGKSTTGPDMQDVLATWYEWEQEHRITITMLLELDGSVGGGGLYAHAVAMPKRLVLLESERTCAVTLRWPNRDQKSFEGALLNLVYTIEKVWGSQK